MYAVPKTRTNKGFSAPLSGASCTVEMQVFNHILQKNSKKAIDRHRLSRPLCAYARTHARTHARMYALSGTNRILYPSMLKMALFAKNTKKALTARFALTMIET